MAAWTPQSRLHSMFAINESSSMDVCDAMVAKETPLWRYVKHELNTLAWASLILVTFLLVRKLCAVLRLLAMGYRLPGPPARALNGQSKCLSAAQGPHMLQDLLARLHQEHGPVVKIWTGPAQLLVSINDVHILQRMLEHAKDRISAPRVALQLVYGQRSLFFSKYSKASQSRLRLEKEINGKFLGEVHKASVKVAESVTQWAEPAKNGGWELDCITFSRLMAFAALGTSLYGEEYTSWPVAREFEKVIMEVIEELPTWMPYSVPPIWNAKFNEFRTKCQRLRALKRQLIGNGRQTRPFLEVEDIGGLTEELFSSWFSSMGIELGSVSEPQSTGIMSHGSLNTAGVLCSVLIQLALHPHIQTKVHDEILTVSGSENPPIESDMKKMTFLSATVLEAARLLPTAPFLQRCSVDHDIELQSRAVIPAGAILAAPVQLLHENGIYWGEDAEIFNPDRFLKDSNVSTEALASKQLYKSNHDVQEDPTAGGLKLKSAYLAFGAGSRSCIGSNFALKQISTLVAVILQRFEVEVISDPCVETSKGRRRLALSPR